LRFHPKESRMHIKFLGAAGTVTGSKYLVSDGPDQVLVDCGLFQGFKTLRLRNWSPPPFDVKSLKAVVLTHAHLDHSGYLPLLIRNGFEGPVFCTEATADLCRILLPDSGRLQEDDAERANRRGYSKHKPALPLYSERDAVRALDRLVPKKYGEDFEAAHKITTSFSPAGHILGSAFVRLSIGKTRVVFSGDLGRPNDSIMRPPSIVESADYLVLESTYGDRRHDQSEPHLAFGEIISRTAKRSGVVVVPTFAVGRAQSLLYCIHRLKQEGLIANDLPVYLNSPMAVDATEVYHKHRTEHRLTREQCDAMCRAAKIVNSVDESKALNESRGPMIILAGSGMATGGRVVHHLKAFAPDPKNAIVFAGFQAGGTRGEKILAGADTVRIHGEDVPVRAEVAALSSLSAHADYAETLNWLGHFRSAPKKTFITHGEPTASDALRTRITQSMGWDCVVPDHLEQFELSD
jgi:metallo-beta-lactamase family protein